MRRFFLFLLFSCFSLIFPEGFSEDTLVATSHGFVRIQECEVGDPLLAAKPRGTLRIARVAALRKITSDYVVHIVLENDELITASPSQKLYVVYKEKWVSAKNLQRGDKLLTIDGHAVVIYSVYLLFEPTDFYLLSLQKPHTFAVSSLRVLAHNFAFPAIAFPLFVYTFGEGFAWAGAGAICSAIFGSIFRGFVARYNAQQTVEYQAALKARKDESDQVWSSEKYCCTPQRTTTGGGGPEGPRGPKRPSDNGGSSGPGEKKPDKKKRERQSLGNEKPDERKNKVKHSADDPKHENGIYEDASYHHQNSRGLKSPSPLDGQGALDNSIKISEESRQRIGYSSDQLVQFKQTSPGSYHGYTVSFESLSHELRNRIIVSGIMK